jgi:hypothetical protein
LVQSILGLDDRQVAAVFLDRSARHDPPVEGRDESQRDRPGRPAGTASSGYIEYSGSGETAVFT